MSSLARMTHPARSDLISQTCKHGNTFFPFFFFYPTELSSPSSILATRPLLLMSFWLLVVVVCDTGATLRHNRDLELSKLVTPMALTRLLPALRSGISPVLESPCSRQDPLFEPNSERLSGRKSVTLLLFMLSWASLAVNNTWLMLKYTQNNQFSGQNKAHVWRSSEMSG